MSVSTQSPPSTPSAMDAHLAGRPRPPPGRRPRSVLLFHYPHRPSPAFSSHPPLRARPRRPPAPLLHTHACVCAAARRQVLALPPLPSLPSLPAAIRPKFSTTSPRQTPVRNAQIVVLTDFSSNPLAALRDRAADPLFLSMLVAAMLLGAILSRLLTMLATPPPTSTLLAPTPAPSDAPLPAPPEPLPSLAAPSPGENAVWLNMTISSLWRLFRKSTSALTKEVLQPALDGLDRPSFVKDIRIDRFSLGATPALVRQITRIPSRSLSDIHYRFTARLVGADDGFAQLTVSVALPFFPSVVQVPVRVSGLDLDARLWFAITAAPFPPFLRAAQWALAEMPQLRLSVSLGRFLPLNSIPILSKALTRILTVELPKQFLFPKIQKIDLAPRDSEGKPVPTESPQPDAQYPKLAALFDSIDFDDNDDLSVQEVARGLVEWGFASSGDRERIMVELDTNRDGRIRLNEFVQVWPKLEQVFVPLKYQGVISGVLIEAKDLRNPTFGSSDPYVVLSVEGQSTISPKDSQTSLDDKDKGEALWNTGWELYVQQPRTAVLRVEVREGSPWTFYRKNLSPPALPTTHSGSGEPQNAVEAANRVQTVIGYCNIPLAQFTEVTVTERFELIGGGSVQLELQYHAFVEPPSD